MISRNFQKSKKKVPSWMVTYADLMTLLLVFFILLFSFSSIDSEKFRIITNSFKSVYEENPEFILENPPSSPIELENPPVGDGEELDKLLNDVQQYLEDYDLGDIVTATREVHGVELVLQENVLFDSGQAVVKQQAKPFLDKVANLLTSLPNLIVVEGHTDSQKIIQPSPYVSNWNLSGDRAANVVNYFVREHNLSSGRFTISAFADTVPIDTNDTVDGRLKNRRVVIVISDEDYVNK